MHLNGFNEQIAMMMMMKGHKIADCCPLLGLNSNIVILPPTTLYQFL
jgi:hypothetical protein